MPNPANLPAYKYLPPEVLLDRYHPNNAQFYQNQQHLKRAIVAQKDRMKPNHVLVAKMHYQGKRSKDIANEIGLTPSTVSGIIHRDDSQDLLTLLRHFGALNQGPSLEHRKRVLWEIIMDNQEISPNISISAMQEMNKMDGVGNEVVDKEISIVINQNMLPRGELDK